VPSSEERRVGPEPGTLRSRAARNRDQAGSNKMLPRELRIGILESGQPPSRFINYPMSNKYISNDDISSRDSSIKWAQCAGSFFNRIIQFTQAFVMVTKQEYKESLLEFHCEHGAVLRTK
jgi:hypothetical protein